MSGEKCDFLGCLEPGMTPPNPPNRTDPKRFVRVCRCSNWVASYIPIQVAARCVSTKFDVRTIEAVPVKRDCHLSGIQSDVCQDLTLTQADILVESEAGGSN